MGHGDIKKKRKVNFDSSFTKYTHTYTYNCFSYRSSDKNNRSKYEIHNKIWTLHSYSNCQRWFLLFLHNRNPITNICGILFWIYITHFPPQQRSSNLQSVESTRIYDVKLCMIYFNCPRIMEEKKILKRAEMTCKITKEDGQEKLLSRKNVSRSTYFKETHVQRRI